MEAVVALQQGGGVGLTHVGLGLVLALVPSTRRCVHGLQLAPRGWMGSGTRATIPDQGPHGMNLHTTHMGSDGSG